MKAEEREGHNKNTGLYFNDGKILFFFLQIYFWFVVGSSQLRALCDTGPRGSQGGFQCTVTLYKSSQHEISRS